MQMKIQIGSLAKERLVESLGNRPGFFKLFYDTEGCGCNGVIVILITDKPDQFDIEIETNLVPFLVDPKQQHNLDETMRLEAEENYPAFKLSSDSNLLSSNIRIRDIRGDNHTLNNTTECLIK
ncbi:iron-sulfur cluster biosynthesis family protein [Paenibacillus anaericanus]|uniref:Iron-sulfur cluster biosynthesis family protein n=2 Tax=Paenibacillus anaericanus TaxID=170367 RepID=A0A433YC75_9BACL|nr:iron-sulfur cluster biosynthesis family protein [Paenibacillus anaericanus]RUT47443.1 iron-sulfur cluster biosynthesis family protein [Paenibacillus anaericanus]